MSVADKYLDKMGFVVAQTIPPNATSNEVSPLDMEEEEFFTWFAGLSSGEATFYSRLKPLPSGNTTVYNEFKIALRVDDKPMLDGIFQRLGVGMVHRIKAYGNAKAQAAYRVIRNEELYSTIIPIFEKYPLKSKKQNDFDVWSQIVTIAHDNDPTEHIDTLATLVQELKEGRGQNIDSKSSIVNTGDSSSMESPVEQG